MSVFMQCYNSLVLYAERYVGVREESMSVVHDVFMALREHNREFEDRESLQKYIYVATRNKALNHIRQTSKARNYLESQQHEAGGHYDRLAFIEEETFRLLAAEIDKLSEYQRRIVLLALDGNSNEEIAQLTGISINTVKFHKRNAYNVLREKMADNYFLSLLL
jgi:RNA polymerase sigma-70 factor (ECF subfamily)